MINKLFSMMNTVTEAIIIITIRDIPEEELSLPVRIKPIRSEPKKDDTIRQNKQYALKWNLSWHLSSV